MNQKGLEFRMTITILYSFKMVNEKDLKNRKTVLNFDIKLAVLML
jgi:hypothetical protein